MPSTNQMHVHGPGCGHIAIQHKNHVDYLDRGRLNTLRASGTLMNTWSKLAQPILTDATQTIVLPDTVRRIGMVQTAAMRRFHTGITLIIWSTNACTTRMAIIATITVR